MSKTDAIPMDKELSVYFYWTVINKKQGKEERDYTLLRTLPLLGIFL